MTESTLATNPEQPQLTAAQEALLQRRAARLAQPRQVGGTSAQTDLLVFRVGRERFALNLAELQGVVAVERVTRVPGASPDLLGLILARGELFPLVDLGRLLHSPLDAAGPSHALLVRSSEKFALAIDEVLEMIRLANEDLRALEQRSPSGCVMALLPDQAALLDVKALLSLPALSGSSAL